MGVSHKDSMQAGNLIESLFGWTNCACGMAVGVSGVMQLKAVCCVLYGAQVKQQTQSCNSFWMFSSPGISLYFSLWT
jgi:hypothetical protein